MCFVRSAPRDFSTHLLRLKFHVGDVGMNVSKSSSYIMNFKRKQDLERRFFSSVEFVRRLLGVVQLMTVKNRMNN